MVSSSFKRKAKRKLKIATGIAKKTGKVAYKNRKKIGIGILTTAAAALAAGLAHQGSSSRPSVSAPYNVTQPHKSRPGLVSRPYNVTSSGYSSASSRSRR
jgi:hypothetical protein